MTPKKVCITTTSKFNLIKLIRDVIRRSLKVDFWGIGAQASFYFILSLFPFLVFLIALLSYIGITDTDLLTGIVDYLPADVYEIVREAVQKTPALGSIALIFVGGVSSVWVASNGIESLIKGLNNTFDYVENRPYWKKKMIAIFFAVIISVIYIFSLVLVGFGRLIAHHLFGFFNLAEGYIMVFNVFRFAIPVATLFTVFVLIYNYLPCKSIGIKKVILGAVVTTIFWMLISQVFSYYVEFFGTTARVYGSLGGIIVLLLWLYWCGIAIMLGGVLNATLYYEKSNNNK